MNLQKLFKVQAELDKKIIEEKGLQGQDLLDKKILALQVELGELANEWQMFKFWKDNPRPNRGRSISIECGWCEGSGWEPGGLSESCHNCNGTGEVGKKRTNDPLLEEYVDCLHFILSIGLEIEAEQDIFPEPIKYDNTVTQFNELFGQISYFASVLNRDNDWDEMIFEYERVWSLFFGLGGELGFTWDEIERAYYAKNKINHERQANGY